MKKISNWMLIIAVILSDIMCATVAYQYRDMLCGIEHSGYSAPADVAFLCGIPYILGIITCFIISIILIYLVLNLPMRSCDCDAL